MEVMNNKSNIKMVEIPLDLLKSIRNLLEVSNDRMKWKIEELLPVGLTIQQLDKILEQEKEKESK